VSRIVPVIEAATSADKRRLVLDALASRPTVARVQRRQARDPYRINVATRCPAPQIVADGLVSGVVRGGEIRAESAGGHGRVDGRDDEMLDVVDPTGEPIATLSRSSVHSGGHWHQVFHCLVARSGLPARVLLQRRKRSARAFPGMLDLSVTGHLLAGERPLDGTRELHEEMGLTIDSARLVSLGRRLLADDHGEGRNREIAHVYLLTDDTPLDQLRLDSNEVAGYVEVALLDVLVMLDVPTVEVSACRCRRTGQAGPVYRRRAGAGGRWLLGGVGDHGRTSPCWASPIRHLTRI